MPSWLEHYSVRWIIIGSIVAVIVSTGLAWLHVIMPKTIKELSGTLVSVGITLGGFFLTALSILAWFSSTEFMKKVLDMKEAYHEMVNTFFATIIANLLLAVVAIVCAVYPLNAQYPGWKTPTSLLPFASCVLFVLCLILTTISLQGFYIVLKKLAK